MGSLGIGWMIHGSLGTMSGGYLFDRFMVEGLRAAGHRVEVISLPETSWLGALGHNWDNDLLEETLDLHLDVLIQDELNHPSLFSFNKRLRRHCRVPVLAVVHHLLGSEHNLKPLCSLYRWVEKAYLDTVAGFVFNSFHTRTSVDALSPIRERSWVIIHPGKNRLGLPMELESVLSRCRRVGPIRLLFVGNIISRKGLLPLIRVLKTIPLPLWHLTVVGSQAAQRHYSQAVKRLAETLPADQIRFLGLLPDSAMRPYYEEADVFVIPSDIEGYGIAYAEAQGFGLPCIAAAKGGAGEIIVPGRNGWLIPFGHPDKLREAVAEICKDRKLLEKMSVDSLETYGQLSTWEKSQEDFVQFLEGKSYGKAQARR